MMKVLIGDGIGIGNAIQFIPTIRFLKLYYNVVCNTDLYDQIEPDLCPKFNGYTKYCIVPFHPPYNTVLRFRIENFFSLIYGPMYKIKGIPCGIGYTKSKEINSSEIEVFQSRWIATHLTKCKISIEDYKNLFYLNHKLLPVKGRLIIGTSAKDKGNIMLPKHNYTEVIKVGDDGLWFNSIKELINMIATAEYYIGPDCGISHIADILNVPGTVIWKDEPMRSCPINLEVIHGND